MPRRDSLSLVPPPPSDEYIPEEDAESAEEIDSEEEVEAEEEVDTDDEDALQQQAAAEQQQLQRAMQASILMQHAQKSSGYTRISIESVGNRYMLSYYDETNRLHVEAIHPESDLMPAGEKQVVLSGKYNGIEVLVLRAANNELYIRFPKPPTEPPPKRPALIYQYGSSSSGSQTSPVASASGIERVPTPYPKFTSSS